MTEPQRQNLLAPKYSQRSMFLDHKLSMDKLSPMTEQTSPKA